MELTGQKLSESKKDLRKFHRAIFAMVLPIAFQNFMTAAVSASDAVMLGFLEQDWSLGKKKASISAFLILGKQIRRSAEILTAIPCRLWGIISFGAAV